MYDVIQIANLAEIDNFYDRKLSNYFIFNMIVRRLTRRKFQPVITFPADLYIRIGNQLFP